MNGTIPRVRGPFVRAEDDFVLQGAHQPYVASDPSGRWWVRKRLQPRGILAEAVGGLLGRLVGVEVPEFAVFDEEDGHGWLSSLVVAPHHWDRSRVGALANPEGIGRMLALDALIHNEDRNTENFIFEMQDDGKSFRCWAIDMESALVGMPRALSSRGTRPPQPHALPSDFVLIETMRSAASEADRDVLCAALSARCRHAPRIVADYLQQIRSA